MKKRTGLSVKMGSCILAFALAYTVFPFHAWGVGEAENQGTGAAAGNSTAAAEDQTSSEKLTYNEYLEKYKDQPLPNEKIEISSGSFSSSTDPKPEVLAEYEGKQNCLKTAEEGSVEWQFQVNTAGLYNIMIEYYPIKGKNTSVERSLTINGEVPFEGADSITFDRIWVNESKPNVDSHGNESRPNQIEAPEWRTSKISVTSGYVDGYTKFYFKQGLNTIRLTSVKEPMVIGKITIYQEEEVPSYQEKKQEYQNEGYTSPKTEPIYIQGEDAVKKSEPTLYAQSDRTSPDNVPYSLNVLKLNTIGGQNWKYSGQWITWEFEVKESGLYRLGIRAIQNFSEGAESVRRILIDDKVLFSELDNIAFSYDSGWQMKTINTADGEECYVYLEAGKHTLTMQNTLGDISGILQQLDSCVYQLNAMYRSIMMITGAYPDANRDYDFKNVIPETIKQMEIQRDVLLSLCDQLVEVTGSKGQAYGSLYRLATQLDGFLKRESTIASGLETFRTNISECASWLSSASEQALLVDYIVLAPEGTELPRADAPWYSKFWNEIKAFYYSFITDYNIVGDLQEGAETVTLWMGAPIGTAVGAGRDQAQVMKTLTQNYFTPQTGIQLDVKLVDLTILLPAVASNTGPDVAISQDRTVPVNYALRKAVSDLTEFENFDEVIKRFSPEAVEAYRIGDGVYGLPETETYPMLFYRTDIMEELGLSIPQTWDDVYKMIPILQKNYMYFALPNVTDDQVNLDTYLMLLYQHGGEVYNEEHTKTEIDSEVGIAAFTQWAEFYTKHGFNKKLDVLTRFRTGEAPFAISTYTLYNSLAVAAPEIKGLWDFTLVPGTRKEDGTIDRSVYCTGTASIMFKNAKNPEASWKFLDWWTSTETQVQYGREIEIMQGAAARWPTANLEAMEQLPWTAPALRKLQEQESYAKGLPEIPGSYITPRYISNAIKLTVNKETSNANYSPVRETVSVWAKQINDEITIKRKEFGFE